MLTARERKLRAQIAAHSLHARRRGDEVTEAARRGLLLRFERDADPTDSLPPAERQRRAWHLYQAHMARMRLARAKARRLADSHQEASHASAPRDQHRLIGRAVRAARADPLPTTRPCCAAGE